MNNYFILEKIKIFYNIINMSITDISPTGLPVSLKYNDLLPSIGNEVSNYQVFVSPSGITQVGPVSTDTLGGVPFVRNDIGFVNTSFPSTNLDFQIPSGHNENVFFRHT